MKFLVILTISVLAQASDWPQQRIHTRTELTRAIESQNPPKISGSQWIIAPASQPVSCLSYSCKQMGAFGCDDESEVLQLSRACRGVSAECVSTVCERRGHFACDEKYELLGVIEVCQN